MNGGKSTAAAGCDGGAVVGGGGGDGAAEMVGVVPVADVDAVGVEGAAAAAVAQEVAVPASLPSESHTDSNDSTSL